MFFLKSKKIELTSRLFYFRLRINLNERIFEMKVCSSLKSKKVRDADCKLVRRHGRVYIINKKNPKMKVRQG